MPRKSLELTHQVFGDGVDDNDNNDEGINYIQSMPIRS